MSQPDDVDILVLSDDIRHHSGFAVNGRLVCWALAEQWNVANASLNASLPATTEVHGREIDIYPAPTSDTNGSSLGRAGMADLIGQCDPAVVVTVIDVQMCNYLRDLKVPTSADVALREPGAGVNQEQVVATVMQNLDQRSFEPRFHWVAQVPIDGHPLPDGWGEFFADVDTTVTMSDYGAAVINAQFPEADPHTIPHGVDFRQVDATDSRPFLVGTVNRNQYRKQYPRLLEAWGKFYERAGQPDDVRFYAHCDYDDDMGWPLDRYIDRHGLRDALIPYQGKVPRADLMALYAQMDVFTSATGGEGYGLTTIEAMSQETPVLITDYTTSEELLTAGEPTPRGSLIDPALYYDDHPEFSAVQRALVDTDQFAETLLDYYHSPERVTREGANAAQWVHDHRSWEAVASQWVELFETHIPPTTTPATH